MSRQEATSIIALPLDVVQARLRDVESWPLFLDGLQLATKTAHQRYRLVVRSGRLVREVEAAVIEHPRERRFTWKSFEGPRYDGEIKLAEVDGGHTRVKLMLHTDPIGLLAGFVEMFGASGEDDQARTDLIRLESHLGPQQPAS